MEYDTLSQTVGIMDENGIVRTSESTFKIPRSTKRAIPIYGVNKKTGDRYVVSFGQIEEV